jgi:hypothetical protein
VTAAGLTVLKWIGYDIAFIIATWVLYLAVMTLAGNRDKLTGFARFIAYWIVLPIGLVCDALLNLHFCLLAWWRPRDVLLTGTLKRIRADLPAESRRRIVATFICGNLLNPFDPKGSHC